MDEGQHTTTGDGRLHEDIELFVASDGELEVAGRYAFYAEIFGCVACRLSHNDNEMMGQWRSGK